MTEYDYAKVLEGLHDKILNDEEMLKKVDHPELYALGMCTRIFNRQKAEIERLQENEQIATAVIAESSAEIERLEKARQKQAQFLGEERGQKYELLNKITPVKSEAVREFAESFEKKIKDVKFTLGQTWEIQNALKDTLKEMVGDDK